MDILKKIYQDFKTYYKNGHELLKKIRDIYYGAPQDVTLQWEDPDTGNIENLSIPSYSKLRDRFMSDVNSAMYKTVFVDAENGSDETGDGSQGAPFKTLRKAIDSIPSGGAADIYLNGHYIMTDSISIRNKSVKLYVYGTLEVKNYSQVSHYHAGFILDSNASLSIKILKYPGDNRNLDRKLIINPENDVGGVEAFIVIESGSTFTLEMLLDYDQSGKIPVEIRNGNLIQLNPWNANTALAKIGIIQYAYNKSFSIKMHSNTNFIINNGGVFELEYIGNLRKFIDENGNEIDLKTKISGVVKDSNGVPRNIISNIVL